MSQVNVDSWLNAAGTVQYYGAVAWVNFNGTGTVAIRASKNVSSITDNSTGDYTVNFTTAMANANYAAAGDCSSPGVASGVAIVPAGSVPTTTAMRIGTLSTSFTALELQYVSVIVFN